MSRWPCSTRWIVMVNVGGGHRHCAGSGFRADLRANSRGPRAAKAKHLCQLANLAQPHPLQSVILLGARMDFADQVAVTTSMLRSSLDAMPLANARGASSSQTFLPARVSVAGGAGTSQTSPLMCFAVVAAAFGPRFIGTPN